MFLYFKFREISPLRSKRQEGGGMDPRLRGGKEKDRRERFLLTSPRRWGTILNLSGPPSSRGKEEIGGKEEKEGGKKDGGGKS